MRVQQSNGFSYRLRGPLLILEGPYQSKLSLEKLILTDGKENHIDGIIDSHSPEDEGMGKSG
jgi:hypothetical protein